MFGSKKRAEKIQRRIDDAKRELGNLYPGSYLTVKRSPSGRSWDVGLWQQPANAKYRFYVRNADDDIIFFTHYGPNDDANLAKALEGLVRIAKNGTSTTVRLDPTCMFTGCPYCKT